MAEILQIKKSRADFSKSFQKTKTDLLKKLKNVEIYHIGSSAVPNLGGKNFIDILIVCPKKSNMEYAKQQISSSGFDFREGVARGYRVAK